MVIPGVTGAGALVRVATHLDDAADAVKAVKAAETVVDSVKAAESAGDAVANAAKVVGDFCSFTPDTQVATVEGQTEISQIEAGDRVLAYDEIIGATEYYPVLAVLEHIDLFQVLLTIDGEQVVTTPEHPFYVEDYGWVPAGDLWVGAEISRAQAGTGTVTAISIAFAPQWMYNLTVAQAHTFFVGQGQWLVHNQCDPLSLLPERPFDTGKTSGILVADGKQVPLISGVDGPGQFAPGGKGSGFDAYTRTHVEGHASAWMQQNNVTDATLYINNPPCPNCSRNLPNMLPPGGSLQIIGPDDYRRLFIIAKAK